MVGNVVRGRTRRVGRRYGATIVVDVPDDVALRYEVADPYPGEEDQPLRGFRLPAEVVNRYPRSLYSVERG
jgi:hypothetical protein